MSGSSQASRSKCLKSTHAAQIHGVDPGAEPILIQLLNKAQTLQNDKDLLTEELSHSKKGLRHGYFTGSK